MQQKLTHPPESLMGRLARGTGVPFLTVLTVVTFLVPLLNQTVPSDSLLHLPTYAVSLLGKYLCYALLAVALDLVWGYCGILSLGHGAFFALGGYAMGMHLMREIGGRGVYGNPLLPDFMVFLITPAIKTTKPSHSELWGG
jgi:urea transport system permease protein